MQINVLEYLEESAKRLPDKEAFIGEKSVFTFKDLLDASYSIGSFLFNEGLYKKPVIVFMERSPENAAAYFGCVAAGCPYVPVDGEMPDYRIGLIIKTLSCEAIIADEASYERAGGLEFSGKIYKYADISGAAACKESLDYVRRRQIDTDLLYVLFTSGSTGVPKGVAVSHRSLIDYMDSFCDAVGLSEDCRFGNQAPFTFDASIKELYGTIRLGATTTLIPKSLFMFPIKLVEFLNEKKINTLCWVVSALNMISTFNTFEKVVPEYVRLVTFVGEVFPIKQLNRWRAALPEARFYNVYGPTEITGICCTYEVTRDFADDETVPVGKPLRNSDVFLLTKEGREADIGETGEICVRGTCLALGYYNDPARTKKAFTTNPLNTAYPERIYKTGDMGYVDENGDLVFVSRKDFQIKHMGHRVELGEIEAVVHAMDGIQRACCIFDNVKKKIILYYAGDASKADVVLYVRDKLPRYMAPNSVMRLNEMPLNANGKIDRVLLREMYEARAEKF